MKTLIILLLSACAACAQNIDPNSAEVIPPPYTNYWQNYTVTCDSSTNATGYYLVLETNNIALPYTINSRDLVIDSNGVPAYGVTVCTTLFSPSNSFALFLPNTNSFTLLCMGQTDGTNTAWTDWEQPINAIAYTFVTITGKNPLGTIQTSPDLTNWTDIASGIQETNITFGIQDGWKYFRTLGQMPNRLAISAHY